jgi:hypothetical protein
VSYRTSVVAAVVIGLAPDPQCLRRFRRGQRSARRHLDTHECADGSARARL